MNQVFLLSTINVIVIPILSNYIIQGKGFIYGNNGLEGLAFDYHVSAGVAVIKSLFSTMLILKSVGIGFRFIRYKIIRYIVKDP